MANKYGRTGIPIDWDIAKSLWVAGRTADEIAKQFGINRNTIETRAKRGKWGLLRKQAKSSSLKIENGSNRPDALRFQADQNRLLLNTQLTKRGPNENANDAEILQRAATIGDAIGFRTRVIKANDSALKVLEENPPTNIGEADRFAETLTKVERIGARAYGYEREAETPVINIAMLTSGNEYDP
jgi:hypothetical protein